MKNQTIRNVGDEVAAAVEGKRKAVADFVEGIGERVESAIPLQKETG